MRNQKNIITNHPLEVIIFSNEEGGKIGSMAKSFGLKAEGLQQKSQIELDKE